MPHASDRAADVRDQYDGTTTGILPSSFWQARISPSHFLKNLSTLKFIAAQVENT